MLPFQIWSFGGLSVANSRLMEHIRDISYRLDQLRLVK